MDYKLITKQGNSLTLTPDYIQDIIDTATRNMDVDNTVIMPIVVSSIPDVITEYDLVEHIAETCAQLVINDPIYGKLAANVLMDYRISNIESNNILKFSDSHVVLVNNNLLSDIHMDFVMDNAKRLDNAINDDWNYKYTYFAYRTLQRGYMIDLVNRSDLGVEQCMIESPQYMWMRVAIQTADPNVDSVIETYKLLAQGRYTHGTPTIFNSCTSNPQLSSCYLLSMSDDSISGIYKTLSDVAAISKFGGGIGLNVHNVRSRGSYVNGSNSIAEGLTPMLKVYNETARYVSQGGKRKGAVAVYLEPWHSDIEEFIELKKNHGKEEFRARDLFYAMWIPDLFMERVMDDSDWSLFSPDIAGDLADVWGEEFNALYHQLESDGHSVKTIKARSLWKSILISQIETGTPYIHYKDAHNSKSNQQNLGTIRGSNLCSEISEYTAPDEIAVCNLASLCLPTFVNHDGSYDYEGLGNVAYRVTKNLNNVIDRNYYPVSEASYSNLKHRPIGIGVQGLADVFAIMGHPFDSPEAKEINFRIFETIYFFALKASCDLADELGRKYESYDGSPVSRGILQFDMWKGEHPYQLSRPWDVLKESIECHGLMNSLLVAPMPTASTAQIWDNNEAFEPFTNNIYVRKTLTGEYMVINKHLVSDLKEEGLWDVEMKNLILTRNGSIQTIDKIPKLIRDTHRTAWDISQQVIIDMAADRGIFVDQSQSMNLFLADANTASLNSMHFYSWKKGLKTGMYYLRSKPVVNAKQFTVVDSGNDCIMCSS